MLIRHKVADFARWKTGYDAHAPARTAAGLKQVHLLTNIDNPNEVVMLFAADDLNKAKAFATSPDLREAMQKAGVNDQPDVHFLTN
jgi:heme-degrading monooxygenase HmoA